MKEFMATVALCCSCTAPASYEAAKQRDKEPPNCLSLVWSERPQSDKKYDVLHDGSENQVISCGTLTSPSAFEAVLRRAALAAKSHDREALANLVDFPLTFIDDSGNRRSLTREELHRSAEKVFTGAILDIFRHANVQRLQVVANKGAYLHSGAIWLQVASVGADPKIGVVNHQALQGRNSQS